VTIENGSQGDSFSDVAAVGPDDLWFVGSYDELGSGTERALLLHKDGSGFHQTSLAVSDAAYLTAVDVTAADDVWALGQAGNARIVPHLTNGSWIVLTVPKERGLRFTFYDITATSATDAWIVGNVHVVGTHKTRPLVMHGDGSTWTVMPHPSVGSTNASFFGVDAIAPDDVWAVGHRDNGDTDITMHWDGQSWSLIPSPSPGRYSTLDGVGAVAPTDVWAVGYSSRGQLLLHWDGAVWSRVVAPDSSSSTVLNRVAGEPGGSWWAVGYVISGDGYVVTCGA
jgi:hypothetical protein